VCLTLCQPGAADSSHFWDYRESVETKDIKKEREEMRIIEKTKIKRGRIGERQT
jgi:hypothetical protein